MLAAKPQTRLIDAKKYFKEHLSVGDYYAEGQSVAGQWFGKGAADLGLMASRPATNLRACVTIFIR